MFYIDPQGPIEPLRKEMLGVLDQLFHCVPVNEHDLFNEIRDMIKVNDEYTRYMAKSLVEQAKKFGIKVQLTKH